VANYLYDGFNILNERDGSGNTTKSYTRGLDFGGGIGSLINQNYIANSTAVTQYYDYNDLGSTADLTTSTGTAASSYSYDAFGNLVTAPAQSDTNRYLFSTKEFDSRSGLVYFGARYYDPEIGRWLTPDPIGFRGGVNFYAYVFNNPLHWIDLWGLQAEEPLDPENQTPNPYYTDSDNTGLPESIYDPLNIGFGNGVGSIFNQVNETADSFCPERLDNPGYNYPVSGSFSPSPYDLYMSNSIGKLNPQRYGDQIFQGPPNYGQSQIRQAR